MKLFRYGAIGAERPGMLDQDGVARDLSGVVDDIGASLLATNFSAIARLVSNDRQNALPGDIQFSPLDRLIT